MSLYQVTRGLLLAHNLHPKKRLGQNFLIDPQVVERIIAAANLSTCDTVVEIGMGMGVLTGELAKRAEKVLAIDTDPDMVLISREVLAGLSNIEIIRASILDWDPPSDLLKFKVVGNLPYYITAPIIEKLIEGWKGRVILAVLTVQKEVAERIIAKPGSKSYGSFSVFIQNHASAEINSLISKRSFYPWPEVSSAVVVLSFYGEPRYRIKEQLVRRAFAERRKILSNSLEEYKIDWAGAGIDPKRRPETLSLAEFEALTQNSPLTAN